MTAGPGCSLCAAKAAEFRAAGLDRAAELYAQLGRNHGSAAHGAPSWRRYGEKPRQPGKS